MTDLFMVTKMQESNVDTAVVDLDYMNLSTKVSQGLTSTLQTMNSFSEPLVISFPLTLFTFICRADITN